MEEIGHIEIQLKNSDNSLVPSDLDIAEIKENPKFDRKILDKMIQKASKDLSEIDNVDDWIKEVRGGIFE